MPFDSKRVVVIGGDAAGMSAASQLRRLQKKVEIIVFEKGAYTSYSACGIPYFVGGVVNDLNKLISRTPEEFQEKQNIQVHIFSEVSEIDPIHRTILGQNVKTGEPFSCSYDDLLITTGATPIFPDVPNAGASGIFGISSLESAFLLKREIEKSSPKKVVVIGGGYIGLEMAEVLHCRLGLDVSVVERAPQVMGTLDPDMGYLVSESLREVGITVYLTESLSGFEVSGGRVSAVVTDKRTLPADLVVLGLGVKPNSKLAERAGLSLGIRGAIVVDDRMETSQKGVWAAGDCVQSVHIVSGRPTHIALGTIANKQGRIAGLNLGGKDAHFKGVLGTAVCKICKYEVARTGLLESDLEQLGIAFFASTTESLTRAAYYPGSGKIIVKLLAERQTGKLLGGQIVGVEGAAKRIDIIATAITSGMTASEMIDLDLSYAPPFSPVWDPVQTCARVLSKQLE